jgi:hypothetical protein
VAALLETDGKTSEWTARYLQLKLRKNQKNHSFYVSIEEKATGYFPALTVKSKNPKKVK